MGLVPYPFFYMITVFDYIQKVKKVKGNIPKQTERIVLKNKKRILDLNRETQLFDKGIDSDGKLLREYKPFTIAIKRQKGEVFNRTTLLDTGSFYKGFDLLVRNNVISIFSRDSKSADLVDKYGNIFGLIKENEIIVNQDIVLPEIWEYLNRFL